MTIKARLGITMAFLGAPLVAIGALGLFGMSRSNDAFLDTYSVQMPGAIAVSNAEMYAARERLVFDRAALLEGSNEVAATIERTRLMRSRVDGYWKDFLALPHDAEEQRLADTSQAKRLELQQLVEKGIAAISANDLHCLGRRRDSQGNAGRLQRVCAGQRSAAPAHDRLVEKRVSRMRKAASCGSAR